MSDDYDWAEDAFASYAVAIDLLRERYLEERLSGESAKEWLERTSFEPDNMPKCCPKSNQGLRGDFKITSKPLFLLVSPTGFEPVTY